MSVENPPPPPAPFPAPPSRLYACLCLCGRLRVIWTSVDLSCVVFFFMNEDLPSSTSGCCCPSWWSRTCLVTVSMMPLRTRQSARCRGARFMAGGQVASSLPAFVGQSQRLQQIPRSGSLSLSSFLRYCIALAFFHCCTCILAGTDTR